MDESEKYEVKFAPEFLEQMSKLPEKDRAEIMAGIEKLRENPYLGTPLYGGPLRCGWNWVQRAWRSLRLRRNHP